MANSTPSRGRGKSVAAQNTPANTPKPKRRKANGDFPLTTHKGTGYWVKKVKGRQYSFGKIADDPTGEKALEQWLLDREAIFAGRPRPSRGAKQSQGLTVVELCDRFLVAKLRSHEAGEIVARTFDEYKATTDLIIEQFGKARLVDGLTADDFEKLRDTMAKKWGPARLANVIQRVRTVFKYGYEASLINAPMRFGPSFKKPSASVMRRHKASRGEKMLEAAELRTLLDAAGVPLKAMLLLGLNCGFGNHDVAMLPLVAVDLERGWINFPRPKTGIPRRCPLWPETVEALRAAIAERVEPRTEAAKPLVFTTVRGREWLVRGIANPVSVAARNLMKDLDIHGQGIGFYTLSHVFRTIADAAHDPVAANHVMGHLDDSMAAVYRERIDDSRLQAVVDHVRGWLFPTESK